MIYKVDSDDKCANVDDLYLLYYVNVDRLASNA